MNSSEKAGGGANPERRRTFSMILSIWRFWVSISLPMSRAMWRRLPMMPPTCSRFSSISFSRASSVTLQTGRRSLVLDGSPPPEPSGHGGRVVPADEASADGHLFALVHHAGGLAGHHPVLVVPPGLAGSALHPGGDGGGGVTKRPDEAVPPEPEPG